MYTTNESLPDLSKISILKTDLSVPEICENIHTNNQDVHVYVSGQKCYANKLLVSLTKMNALSSVG